MTRNTDNDWLFDKFDNALNPQTKKAAKKTGLALFGVWLFLGLLNVAFWGGLIWFVFFLLNHYGVI